MGYAQPQYGPPKQPTDFGQMLRKIFLILIMLVGALLLFVGRILQIFQTGLNGFEDPALLLLTIGALMIAVPAIVWALGSKRTSDMQNVGLLVLAAFMIAYFV